MDYSIKCREEIGVYHLYIDNSYVQTISKDFSYVFLHNNINYKLYYDINQDNFILSFI